VTVQTGPDLRTIRTDHVGGLPRPIWLREKQAAFERGELGAEALEAAHRDAVAQLVARQEQVGVPIVTDGEVSRRNFQESFGGAVTGFDSLPYRYPMDVSSFFLRDEHASTSAIPTTRAASGMPENGPAIIHRRPTVARLRLVRNLLLEEYLRASSVASTPAKVTLIGPDRILQRFAHENSREVYRDTNDFMGDVVDIERKMIAEVIEAGCRYIQIDEPGYTAYVDPLSLETMRRRGEDPRANLERGIAADNSLIAGFAGVTFAVHICRGGGGGRGGRAFHREGHYDAIAERLYQGLNFDRFLLEYDSEAAGGFESLRYMPEGKIAVLGLISNHGPAESRQFLESRLEEATKFISLEQTAICPRCGLGGLSSDEEVAWRKLALLQEVARDIWR
jgi:5-methyltetrahydropteroyltriglutamate--homocysteine methyltransferase